MRSVKMCKRNLNQAYFVVYISRCTFLGNPLRILSTSVLVALGSAPLVAGPKKQNVHQNPAASSKLIVIG